LGEAEERLLSETKALMMMIAVITMKSSLVPLIEGLCAHIYFRFEISMVLYSHFFAFLFWKKNSLKKKTVSPRSHPTS